MKKSYKKPDLYNVTFDVEDIITTSPEEHIDTHNNYLNEALWGGMDWSND